MSQDAIRQARALLAELKTQATGDALTPDRLEALDALLAQAETESPAEAARRESAHFVSLAAHDMRLPLTSIRGYADMLGKGILGALNEQQAQFVEVIRANALRLERLIADVNDLSKLRAGALFLEPRLDLAKNILLLAEKETRPLAEERGQALVFQVPDGLPLLNVDGKQVARALGSLIRNALFYSPEGSAVTVTASAVDGGLRVAVTDEGIGMTAEEQAHLGEPFWRSEHEAVREVKGHGLGYAVARGLIELMGGAMFYETAFEQGSTFGFTLPGAG